MPKKKQQEVLVFQEYWQRYGDLDSVVEVAARRAWTFGVLQTQRIYLPVVQENEKLKAEIKQLKDECRRTKRALDSAYAVCPHRARVNYASLGDVVECEYPPSQ